MADNPTALGLLKQDLGISTTAYDNLLNAFITRAREAIKRQGISLSNEETVDETMLVVQYAAYFWRSRKGEDQGMPVSLRFDLNNRYIQQHAAEAEE